jgi:hypothetical protein
MNKIILDILLFLLGVLVGHIAFRIAWALRRRRRSHLEKVQDS